MPILIGAESNHVRESKTVLDSEFHRGFRIPGARFRIPIINRILDSLRWISDFKARDSEFQKQNSRIPESELPYTGRIKDRHIWLLGDTLLVTAMPSGREVPSSIPTCDLKSLVNSDFFPVRVVLSSCN